MTYVALANITLGSSASSVTFSSIPNTFRDLVVVIDATISASDTSIDLEINADTNSGNYSSIYAFGAGSGSPGSGTLSSSGLQVTYSPSGGRQLIIAQLLDYSATDKHKTLISRGNATSGSDWVSMWAGRWASTTAVNQIRVKFPQTRTFSSGTTMALYGIRS